MGKLNSEELEILKAYEADILTPVADVKLFNERYKKYATATFQKDARINIRLSSKDLRLIQKRALSEGLPYQTLISSLLHKFAEGRLTENG